MCGAVEHCGVPGEAEVSGREVGDQALERPWHPPFYVYYIYQIISDITVINQITSPLSDITSSATFISNTEVPPMVRLGEGGGEGVKSFG